MGDKGNFFPTVGYQLINVEGMRGRKLPFGSIGIKIDSDSIKGC